MNYARGHGESMNAQIFTTSGVRGAEWPFYFFDFAAGTDVPSVVPVLREVDGAATTALTDTNRADLTALTTYNLGTPLFQDIFQNNDDTAFTVDFDKNVDWGIISGIEFGSRWGLQEGERFRFRGDDDETNAGLSGRTFEDLNAAYPGLIVRQPFQDVLDGASGDYPREWFSLDSDYLTANAASLREEGGIVPVLDEVWGYDVERDTMAFYAKANFEGVLPIGGISYSGNVGVRTIDTKAKIKGATEADGEVSQFSSTKKYTNVLPSGNISFILKDDLFLRFGAANTIARPSLDDIAPNRRVQFFADAGNGGNPDLLPEEVTQFDASLEKYFGSTNLLSIAYFYKDFGERIEDGVLEECITLPDSQLPDTSPGDDGCSTNQNLIRLSVPANVGAAEVSGFEFGYQHAFDFLPSPFDGLGVIANYTLIDIDGGGSISATGLALPVQDLSENSYNLVAFYEKYGFSGRVAYNWRDEFYDERTSTNQASFAEEYGQLDASASYDINKTLTINFEAINILNEPELRYQEIEERLIAYRVNDTRFVGGIRFRF